MSWGPYQFKPEDAEDFARFIGAKAFKVHDELFFQKCPYCQMQTNDKKTFSINLHTGVFNCFRASCHVRGNMITLAKDFNFSLGQNADEYYKPKRHYKVWNEPKQPLAPKERSLAFLESRGIPADVAERYEITENKDGNIVFVFRDETGKIQFIKYRNPAPKENEAKEWCERDCKPILFGMWQCNPENKTLIITEGQIDSLSVAAAGLENAVSVPTGALGFTWVPYCWDWMQKFERIIVFGDHEKGHITLYADVLQRWKGRVWCVRPEDYKDCKDANDILRKYGAEQVRHCIDNAAQPPITNITDLGDVEDVDVNAIPKLPTKIQALNDTLRGGLPFGQLILVTGKAGDGKSTFANQIIVDAIDEGYKVFIYSGELPNFLLKSWLTYQAAGPWNTHSVRRYGNGEAYEVYSDAKQKISRWFHERAWIYDNRIATDEETEQAKLVELLEEVIERHAVRVILLDNLMTALDLEPDKGAADKYDGQSLFMKKLTRIALKHGVLIILVAHKRKNGSSETNDTVSGSADIVNLASIVLSYERGSKDDGDGVRWLKVSKNRLFGVLNDGIKLEYNEQSKRIHEADAEPAWHYGWETMIEEEEADDVLPWEKDDEEDNQI